MIKRRSLNNQKSGRATFIQIITRRDYDMSFLCNKNEHICLNPCLFCKDNVNLNKKIAKNDRIYYNEQSSTQFTPVPQYQLFKIKKIGKIICTLDNKPYNSP